MKLSDIIKQVNRDIDDSFNSADIIDWVNRCLDDLTPIARKEAYVSLSVNSTNNTYTIPTDLYTIYQFIVTDSDTSKVRNYPVLPISDRVNRGVKVWGTSYNLQNGPTNGTIELYYYATLNYLVNPDDVPEIDPQFHDLLILYASAMSQFLDERPDKESDLMNRYYARKKDFEDYIVENQMTDDILDEVW